MDINGYREILDQDNHYFTEYLHFLLQTGIDEISDDLLNSLTLKKWGEKNVKDQDIIDYIFFRSEKEKRTKEKKKDYYKYNAICFLKVLRNLYNEELYNNLKKMQCFEYEAYRCILYKLLSDEEEMLSDISIYIPNKSNPHFSVVHVPSILPSEMQYILNQILYGSGGSFHSESVSRLYISITVVRLIIEQQIRRAVDIAAFEDINGNIKPIAMRSIFNEIKKHKHHITCKIDISTIERIYSWANIFVHSGETDYIWKLYFIAKYIEPLSFNDDTIIVPTKIITTIQDSVLNQVGSSKYGIRRFSTRNIYWSSKRAGVLSTDSESKLKYL